MFEDDLDGIFGQQVATGGTSLDGQLGKVIVEGRLLEFRRGSQLHLDDLGLAVGVGGEIQHLGIGLPLGQVVFLVTGDAHHGETLDIEGITRLSVTVDGVIGGAVIVFAEHSHMDDVGADKELRLKFGHHVGAFLVEDDDVVHVGAVGHEDIGVLVLLPLQALAGTDETLGRVDVQLLVVGRHGLR